MRNPFLLLSCLVMLYGCGSVTEPISSENNKKIPSVPLTVTGSGIVISVTGSEIRGVDFIVKGVSPLYVDNRLIATNSNILMAVAATTTEGWIHVSAIDTESMDGKFIKIPASQNTAIEVITIKLINQDYQSTAGNISVKFEELR